MQFARQLAPQLAHHTEASRVLTKAAVRAAERLGLSGRLLGQIIGVSEATVSRWRHGEGALPADGKAYQLAALFVRAWRSLDAIVGGDDAVARAWLTNPNEALAARPIDRMFTPQGLVDVTAYLDARRAPL